MNKVYEMGRMTREPDAKEKYTRFTLAVDKYGEGADFIPFKCFGKTKDFVDTYLHKGTKILVEGHIATGSYEADGRTEYTLDIIADRCEFCEKKADEFSKADEEGLPFE